MGNHSPGTANLVPFAKGDPRIHRGGKPHSFEEVRKLAIKIGNKPASDQGRNPYLERARDISCIEAIFYDWFNSNDFRKQNQAMAYAFGAPPTQVQLSGKDGEPLSPLLLLLQELRGVAAGQLESGEPAVEGEVRLLEAPADLDASDPSI
jgi:hypothetical protein